MMEGRPKDRPEDSDWPLTDSEDKNINDKTSETVKMSAGFEDGLKDANNLSEMGNEEGLAMEADGSQCISSVDSVKIKVRIRIN